MSTTTKKKEPEPLAEVVADKWLKHYEYEGFYYTRARRTFTEMLTGIYGQDAVDAIRWCRHCENPGLDHTEVRGEWVCPPCYTTYRECSGGCGEVFSTNDMLRVAGGERVCRDCRETQYEHCADCNVLYRRGGTCGTDHDLPIPRDTKGKCRCKSPALEFRVPNAGNDPLVNDVRTTVTLPEGLITREGFMAIATELQSWYYRGDEMEDQAEREGLYSLAGYIDAMDPEWQTKRGNFTKRLSSLANKELGLKIRPMILSRIGDIAREHSSATSYDVEVTRDLNQHPSEFANGESCWWQSYSYGRCTLKSNGGFGLRSFGTRGVNGRVWVLPLKEAEDAALRDLSYALTPTFETLTPAAFLVFNGYRDLSGYTGPRVMAHMAGLTYCKVGVVIDPMYVNSNTGYLVGPEELISRYRKSGSLRMNLNTHSDLHRREHPEAITEVIAKPKKRTTRPTRVTANAIGDIHITIDGREPFVVSNWITAPTITWTEGA